MPNDGHASAPRPASQRVIIAGYGPVGRAVAELLVDTGVHVTIIELNLVTIEKQLKLKRNVVYGDCADLRTLECAGIRDAAALILAIPDEDKALAACAVARQANPDIFIAARTNFLSKGMLATRAGADEVIVEELVTAEAMKQAVLKRLLNGVPSI